MSRVIACLLLAGCVAAPATLRGYRDPAAPIYSNAVIGPADLAGDWTQVASFAPSGGCVSGRVAMVPAADAMQVTGSLCLGGAPTDVSGVYAVTGPGRLQQGTTPAWWVIWADTNLRTLAIGTPDGRFGFVLNKGSDLPQDRLTAVRSVFDFNGYDPAGLRLR